MINYLKGIIVETTETALIVDVGGVGYELAASLQTLNILQGKDKVTTVFVHMSLREDAVTLFGFATKQEKAMFLRLITVSGIGPKLAISVLSGLSVDALATAIASGDFARLNSVKGIGKKTAERIVLELKDKVSSEYAEGEAGVAIIPQNQDAILALISMGYSRQEAQSAVASVKDADSLSVEDIVISSLKTVR